MKKATGRPFKKGDARINRRGRTRRPERIRALLMEIGGGVVPDEVLAKLPPFCGEPDATWLTTLCRTVYVRALQGESWAVNWIADRTEGKVKDVVEMQGGETLRIVESIVSG